MLLRFLVSTLAACVVVLLAVALPLLTSAHQAQTAAVAGKPKVFVVGLSKTGTTSLGDALSRLGYRRSGWEDVRSRWLYHAWSRGYLRPLQSHAGRFDAFEDIPWAQAYRRFADIYPSAKFVLSRRHDEQTWLNSVDAHTIRRRWDGHRDLYGCYEARHCRQSYLDAYRKHNEDVVRFFAARNESHRLLTFVIDGPPAAADRGSTEKAAAAAAAAAWDTSSPVSIDARWKALIDFLQDGELGWHIGTEELESLGEFPKSNGREGFGNRDPYSWYWMMDRSVFLVEHGAVMTLEIASSLAYRLRRLRAVI